MRRIQKSEVRAGKIYEHIAKDLREMMDRKVVSNGGYVMPKLINLSLEGEKKKTEGVVTRKGNIFIHQCDG